jgi:hypothetical protein
MCGPNRGVLLKGGGRLVGLTATWSLESLSQGQVALVCFFGNSTLSSPVLIQLVQQAIFYTGTIVQAL